MNAELRGLRQELALLIRRGQEGYLSEVDRVRLDVVRRLIMEAESGYRPVAVDVAA